MEEYYKYVRKYIGKRPLILPGSVVLLLDKNNRILLQKRFENTWGLPGGLMNIGESLEQTALREVKEETGLQIKSLTLLNVFSGESYYFKNKNGDEVYSVTAVFMSNDYEGKLKRDGYETKKLKFFDLSNLPENLTDEYKGYILPFSSLIMNY